MSNRIKVFPVLMLSIMIAFALFGCFKATPPTDEEAIKAIMDTGLFSGGVEKFTLTEPLVVVEKGKQNKDGSWTVKVKVSFSYKMADGTEKKLADKIQPFRLVGTKDSTGKTVWKARLSAD